MGRDGIIVTIPSFFKCPISLDVMKSPVSLCTGISYDRSSIQTWLDDGNNTCPATMQVLESKEFVPNRTLHRLINVWLDSLPSSSAVSPRQVRILIKNMENGISGYLDQLPKILSFAKYSDENRKFLASFDGFVQKMVSLLSSISGEGVKVEVLEQIIKVLNLIMSEYRVKEEVCRFVRENRPKFFPLVVMILQKGSLDSKLESVRFLEAIANDAETKSAIAGQQGLMLEILSLVNTETDSKALDACLSCLIALSDTRPIKIDLVRMGIIQVLGKRVINSENSIIEKALKLLEMLSTTTAGRTTICDDPICLSQIVHRMLKISNSATDHAILILWRLCYVFCDQKAQDSVTKNNGMTKILLLLQSDCSPIARRMCRDLIKVFRGASTSCLPNYDTKTTHIMPY